MKNIYLFLVLFFLSLTVSSQTGGESIYIFLNGSGSARQAALGGRAITLTDDVNQPIFNPATINQKMVNKLGVNYISFLAGINYLSTSYAFRIKNIETFHFGAVYNDYGKMIRADEGGIEDGEFGAHDLAFSLGYAHNFKGTDLYLGANVKLINSVIDNYSSFGIGSDIGFMIYNEDKPFMFTLVARNIGYQMKEYDEVKEDLPFEIMLGMSYKLEHVPIKWHFIFDNLQKWDVAVSNPSNSTTDVDGELIEEEIGFVDNAIRHLSIGAELFPENIINIRLGYNFRRSYEMKLIDKRTFAGISAGFGLNFKKFSFNYAYTKYHPAANTSTFSLQINFQ